MIEVMFVGFAVGFVVQMPVGPTALFCFRRFLVGGAALALATGLGTAVGDTVYAAITVAGLHGLAAMVTGHEAFLRVMGGAVLVALGLVLSLRPLQVAPERSITAGDIGGAFGSMLVMALLNPATIIVVGGLVGGLGLSSAAIAAAGGFPFLVGFLVGSCCWWLVLTEFLVLLRKRVSVEFFSFGARASGVAIVLAGIALLIVRG